MCAIRRRKRSLIRSGSRYNAQYWEVTMCQWQKRFDPTFLTYSGTTANLGDYDYAARKSVPGVFPELAAVETTGKIKKPLVSVAGTMDALLPIKNHGRGYEDVVNASRRGNNDKRQRAVPPLRGAERQPHRGLHVALPATQTDPAARATGVRPDGAARGEQRPAAAEPVHPGRRSHLRDAGPAGSLREAARVTAA